MNYLQIFLNSSEKFVRIEDVALNFLCRMESHQNATQRLKTIAVQNGDFVVQMRITVTVLNVWIIEEMISQVHNYNFTKKIWCRAYRFCYICYFLYYY